MISLRKLVFENRCMMDIVFPFPFEPYAIQKYFMKELYNTIQNRKFGIFESPTGTGKSLSICCGTLKWLQDNYQKNLEVLEADIAKLNSTMLSNTNSDDWLVEEYEKLNKNRLLTELSHKLDRIKRKQQKYEQMKVNVIKEKTEFRYIDKQIDLHCNFKSKNVCEKDDSKNTNEVLVEDMDLLLHEDQEVEEDVSDEENKSEDTGDDIDVKIFISSRTHSQLSQFAGEIKRSPFGSDTRVVTLASRQQLCINEEVLKLKNIDLINQRCLDMQKSKNKTTSTGTDGKVLKKTKINTCNSCPYYNQRNIHKLTQRILVDIMDIEDLVQNGKALKACPYYATKHAVDDAQVVLMSHANLVGSGARAGRGVHLRGHVLVVDEAHALEPALQRAHSAPLPHPRLHVLLTTLRRYTTHYATRFASHHLLHLNQIIFVVGRLLGLLERTPTESSEFEQSVIYTLEDFVIKAEIDHLNFRPLVEFCKKKKLAPILHGFSLRYNISEPAELRNLSAETKRNPLKTFLSSISKEKPKEFIVENIGDALAGTEHSVKEENDGMASAGSALYALLEFLERLCERSTLGRVLVARGPPQSAQLKYLLLEPARPFLDLVGHCRSVVVAGGTMEPMSEFEELLGRRDLTLLRCDHVVPADHVLAICLSEGPSGMPLCFSYQNRNSTQSMDEIGRILKNVCSVIPEGIVCFLPSYSYEQTLYNHLEANKIIQSIAKKKKIFREPKTATGVDKVLREYGAAAARGALLLSVVGGKLSEGLNFSDELGRCVLVVGMPYPNVKSVELQEKMNYLNRTFGGNAGKVYYENLCMKAVNQCIGRAVRHVRDYACVVLVDGRYSRASTRAALPAYVQKSLIADCNFGSAVGNIAKFFARHKQAKKQ